MATIQSVGSSGGLKVGADFIRRWFPDSGVWVSDPTWDNHRSMFEGAGLTGMRERAALVNGTIRFDSEEGEGTHVIVEIPLP